MTDQPLIRSGKQCILTGSAAMIHFLMGSLKRIIGALGQYNCHLKSLSVYAAGSIMQRSCEDLYTGSGRY